MEEEFGNELMMVVYIKVNPDNEGFTCNACENGQPLKVNKTGGYTHYWNHVKGKHKAHTSQLLTYALNFRKANRPMTTYTVSTFSPQATDVYKLIQ